jgi:hypothetical protein
MRYGRPEIFNTDQGSQFTSDDFTGTLKRHGVTISMDGKGRCMDNIFVERLWRSLNRDRDIALPSVPEMCYTNSMSDATDLSREVNPAEAQQTDAMTNFEANVGLLVAFINRLKPSDIQRSAKSAIRVVARYKADPKDTKPIERAVAKLTELTSEWSKVREISFEWMSVMLVTFTEAYLEDGLIGLPAKNPNLLKDAPPIPPNRMIEAESLDELRQEITRQWAHQKIEGGPRKFIRRLKDMGARGYNDTDIYRLEHLWDTRNLIVHSRGIVDAVYLRKYKHRQKGDRVTINLGWWLPALKNFTEATDQFFLNYVRQKDGQDNKRTAQKAEA